MPCQVLGQKDYEEWSLVRQQAISAIENREELLMDTAVQLETSLTLIGELRPPSLPRTKSSPAFPVLWPICLLEA